MDTKKISQILLGLSVLFFLILTGARYIIGGWIDFLYMPLFTFLILFSVGLALDFKNYISFFTHKTTAKGLSVGSLIIMVLLFLGAINYFAVRYNKNIDFTEEKLFTLSEQTVVTLEKLDKPSEIIVFHRGKQDTELKRRVTQLIALFQEKNNKLHLRTVNVFENPIMVQKYLTQQDAESKGLIVFLNYKNKVIRINHPHQEEQFTQAIVKSAQLLSKKIYFFVGHKERDINSIDTDPEGLSNLKKTLEGYSFKVDSFSAIHSNKIPNDAAMLAIVGAQSEYLDTELDLIRSYVKSGGSLLLALDPGQATNLYKFVREFGIDFKNNYVLDPNSSLGQSVVISSQYSSVNAITENFGDRSTVFNLASELKIAKTPSGKDADLVFAPAGSVAIKELSKSAVPEKKDSLSIAAISNINQARVLVFGDSDFMNNQFIFAFSNRDLVINSFAHLTQQKDLISIKPKNPKTSFIQLTQMRTIGLIIGSLLLPLLLLCIAFVVWLKQRGD